MSNDIKQPNLFIVGAAKCGTTSLAAWLSEHPQIFMSHPKEPCHFNSDLSSCFMPDRREYESLFASVERKHVIVGEASTHYIYSSAALPKILEYNPDARFIAMVRNPVEMARSLHSNLLFWRNEDIKDFEQAWRLQAARSSGQSVPPLCRDREFLHYGSVCRLGEQINRMFDEVPREQRYVVVLDELKEKPLQQWRKLLKFLDVKDDGRTHFPVHNVAQRNRSKILRSTTTILGRAKGAIGLPRFRLGILRGINRLNRHEQPNDSISPEFRKELNEYFRDDVGLLGELLERDFGAW